MTDSNVKYLHYRHTERRRDSEGNPVDVVSSRRGATVAYTITYDGRIAYATAFCGPNDNYNKHFGRVKSAGRLKSTNHVEISDAPDSSAFIQSMDDFFAVNEGYSRR